MLQVENEYGSYANDSLYMVWLRDRYREAGFDVPLFTSDGGAGYLLASGNVVGATPVVNFGGNPQGEFAELEKFRPGIPQMNGEFWCGWFTHWGNEKWGGSDLEQNAKDLEWMLSTGRSFNLYMFHGGTNFGWSAGANWDGAYKADITSYDYDAPLDEAGRPTEKYRRFREILARYQPEGRPLPEVPAGEPFITIDSIRMTGVAPLFSNLPPAIRSAGVKSMETFGQNHGYILYRTRLRGPVWGPLRIEELHDVAYVFLDGAFVGRLERRLNQNAIEIPPGTNPRPVLDILVEGMGRINFGSRLIDRKGITEWVTLRGVTLTAWEVTPLPFGEAHLKKLRFQDPGPVHAPALFRGEFTLQRRGDVFLDCSGWSKGVVWVNGRNLGRYWSIGPQQRLYVPAPWLKEGTNEVIVFDPEATAWKGLRGVESMK
jgi:beta-galactosidase GanA